MYTLLLLSIKYYIILRIFSTGCEYTHRRRRRGRLYWRPLGAQPPPAPRQVHDSSRVGSRECTVLDWTGQTELTVPALCDSGDAFRPTRGALLSSPPPQYLVGRTGAFDWAMIIPVSTPAGQPTRPADRGAVPTSVCVPSRTVGKPVSSFDSRWGRIYSRGYNRQCVTLENDRVPACTVTGDFTIT